ncbi:hypothetical protein FSARC_4305 [Fusarium sarcochroum]|uniref:Heterokaryon incompatibility domain-containing protein n=1 Tax=Fusarium sarcochroum TaxID=1208366 RepID=A0A8H4XBR3_9HYPO|nr:hypothetical protein FSARC_4305 [Fusarium sarcochroum]
MKIPRMDWHDPDCRRIDPVPFDDKLWTCQACGTIGPLDFSAEETAIESTQQQPDQNLTTIKPLSWPACVDYATISQNEDTAKALSWVKERHQKIDTGITYQVARVSDAYGRELQPVIYPQLIESSHIRLLKLLPAHYTMALEGSLLVVDVEKAPDYKALSYTWADANGDATLCRRIFIGQEKRALPVTLSCYRALRHLRQQYEPVLLWVDSICINQSDLGERSYQVAMMDAIFSKATMVHVYVGEDDHGSHTAGTEAITLLKSMAESSEPTEAEFKYRVQSILNPFFRRPFFSRLWVVQEVLLAQSITLHCGDQSTPISKDMIPKILQHGTDLPWWMVQIGFIGPQDKGNLGILLSATARCRMQDLRDRIFGLLGLIGSKEAGALRADYKLMVREVFIGTAAYLIQHQQRHDLIEVAESMTNNALRTRYGIPSWVPMWNHKETMYTAVDMTERLGDIQRSLHKVVAKNPSHYTPVKYNPNKSFFKVLPLSEVSFDTDTWSQSPEYPEMAVDAETGCLVTSGHEFDVPSFSNFEDLGEFIGPEADWRLSHYSRAKGCVSLFVSSPKLAFRDEGKHMFGLEEYLALIRIRGCRSHFIASRISRSSKSIRYKILYPCLAFISYPIFENHLYSQHPDFEWTCILEGFYPLRLKSTRFLYHWRYLVNLKLRDPRLIELCEPTCSSLEDEDNRAINFWSRYAVLTAVESPFGLGQDGVDRAMKAWRLKLDSDPRWKSNRESSLVDDLLSELSELLVFWNSNKFLMAQKLIDKLYTERVEQRLDYWKSTLVYPDHDSDNDDPGYRPGSQQEELSRTNTELKMWQDAWKFLFEVLNDILPATVQRRETMSLFPTTLDEINELAESWLGANKDEQEILQILRDRWLRSVRPLSLLLESAPYREDAEGVLERRQKLLQTFGMGREFEKIVIE